MIANDTPGKLARLATDMGLEFPMLVDPGAATIRAFGILNEAADDIPHPATVVVDPAGVARFVRVDEDYWVRPTPEEIFTALGELQTVAGDAD